MNQLKFQALSEIILPSGSTSTELQAAIDNAAFGDTITISGDMPFTDTVTIQSGKKITIQSDADNNWGMSVPGANVRHFEVIGNLILQNITLDGDTIGGGIYINGGSLMLNDDASIQNCAEESEYGGGAVFGDNKSNFTMSGGKIIGNKSELGGGLYLIESSFIMNGGEISNNTALSGGGIFLDSDSSFTMNLGAISNNVATAQGGGFYIYFQAAFKMNGGRISGNVAEDGHGGGIFLYGGTVEITGESYITNNSTVNDDGGGIYVFMNDEYNNIIVGSTAIFSCNSAKEAYEPPKNASTLYPNLKFASTSITNHVLNNFDIGTTEEEPIEKTFHVTYNANGGNGSHVGAEITPGASDVVLSADVIGISRPNHTLIGWNTERNGSGVSYVAGNTITLNCSAVLFAQWITAPAFYTVSYGANGGKGSHVDPDMEFELNYKILSTNETAISRPGFLFVKWNTMKDGKGISYAPGDTVKITNNIMLYAQWMQFPNQQRLCRSSAMKRRTSIEGQKLWVDNDNAGNTRPASVEIVLNRDGEVYKRTNVDPMGDGYFGFCCLPVWKNSEQKYSYKIDELVVPAGYTKTIEGNNIINTFTP